MTEYRFAVSLTLILAVLFLVASITSGHHRRISRIEDKLKGLSS